MPTNLRRKLSPENLAGVNPAMVSVLGVLLGEALTSPSFDELLITPQGGIFLKHEGSAAPSVYLGPISQVQAQLSQVAAKVHLTSAEFKALDELFAFRTHGVRLYH